MRLRCFIRPALFLFLMIVHEMDASGIIPGSVNACKIKKLVVRITRVIYTMYGDTTEPPITEVVVNYYDPESKKAKNLGKTEECSNGRSLWPIWTEQDGTLESDDHPGLM